MRAVLRHPRRILLPIALLASTALATGCGTRDRRVHVETGDAADEISAVLQRQAEAWNRGDLDGFMADYHADVTFASGGSVTRGRDQTLARYRRRYATREEMGTLTFSSLEFTPLAERAMLVLGEWRLQRKPAPIGGNFSLVFTKAKGTWSIIHDHTSSRE